MSLRLRKVPTASGATAVQIVTKRHGKLTVIEHLGSAHTPAQLAALEEAGRQKINDATGQLSLDLDSGNNVSTTSRRRVRRSASRLLIDTIRTAYNRLGFYTVDDEAFFQLVLARLVEPTSKADSIRVLDELGVETKHRSTFTRCLQRINTDAYRETIAAKCFDYSVATTGISLILYDVTTLLCRRRHKRSTSKPRKKTGSARSATRKNAASIRKSLSDCWSIGPGFRWRSGASKATKPRPTR